MTAETPTITVTVLPEAERMMSRDIEIRQGMAVTGITLAEARRLLELLPAAIQALEVPR